MMKMYLKRVPIRIIAFVVAFAMLASLMPALPQEAAAAANPRNPRTSGKVVTWDCVWFGHYPQKSNGSGGFNNEPIKWRVLFANANEALLLADKNLDAKQYHTTYTDVTWQTSTVRKWLNGTGSDDFIGKAFTSAESAAIKQKTIQNPNNPDYSTAGGKATQDKVFFLSIEEAEESSYGFVNDDENESKARRTQNTDYAKNRGAYTNNSTAYAGNGDWWLRSPGNHANIAANVHTDGYVHRRGNEVNLTNHGVRPALYLNLNSSVWTSAGTVSSDGKTTPSLNPILKFVDTQISKDISDSPFTNKLTKTTDGTVTYSSSDTNVATVNKTTGLVTVRGGGKTTITVTAAAGADYKAGSASYELTVSDNRVPLDIEHLTYKFENSAAAFGYSGNYHIPLSSYQRIFGNTTKAKTYYAQHAMKPWGGNCAGFAATSAILHDYSNDAKPSSFKANAKLTSELSVSDKSAALDMDVTEFLEAMQIAQYTQLFKNARIENNVYTSSINDGQSNLNKLYQMLKEDIGKGTPALLAICQEGGHALLAYKIEEISNMESRVHVYDSNYPKQDRYFIFKKNNSGDWVSWSYDMGDVYGVWSTETASSYISYIPYSIIAEIWKTRGNLKENENMAFVNTKDVAIYDGNDKLAAMVYDGQLVSSKPDIYMMDDELERNTGGGSSGIALGMPIDVYRLKNLDASVDDFQVSVIDTNLGVDVNTSAKEITVAVDDSCNSNAVYIHAATSDNYSVTLNSSYAYDNGTVMAKGKGSDDFLEISQCKGDINISNCQITSLTVDGKEVATHKISSQAGSGGSISPVGEQIVSKGKDMTYTITSDPGYTINDVKVDGKSAGAVSTYTFKNVQGNHTISAEFNKLGKTDPGKENPSANADSEKSSKVNNITAANITKTYSKATQKFFIGAKAEGGAKLSYKSSNKSVAVNNAGIITVKKKFMGKATITITSAATPDYNAATKKITVTVNPTKTKLSSVQNMQGKRISIKWKKNGIGSGYQIQYAANKKFSSAEKIVTVKKNKNTARIVKGLKKGKTYYVRIRTYKSASGTKVYSGWSKPKRVKIKK